MLGTPIKTATKLRTTLKSAPPMQSVRFHGPRDIRVDEVEEPMKPAYVGICGSDLHEFTSAPLSHEFDGIIEEVGEGVTHVSPGQRAVVRPTIYDGNCSACKLGYNHCCENIGFIGLSGFGGGMSRKIVAPAAQFYPIPDNVSLKIAALIEPLEVSWYAVNLSPFKPGDSVLIVGGGPIGIGIVQVLKLQGATRIMVAELMENRKKLCGEYGATNILDPREVDIASRVHQLTDGGGADVIFDAAGVEKALLDAIPACRTQGTIVNIAVWEKNPAIPVNQLMCNELRYMVAALYDEMSFLDVIRAISHGHLTPENMITAKIPLDQVVAGGFKALLEHRHQHCKILVDVQA
ncbi:hypothetical protein N7493_008974 [Penicillium malachiteum]|uniref:Enoyl reductase (ER) domain-containing protein n=1 Tax=Penicillium malachiteum TaxID=1324776 RepID=A0AAD6HG91_9EURO|nr:hypothetical protein N7493_008974 [Penicillium malachiteum]